MRLSLEPGRLCCVLRVFFPVNDGHLMSCVLFPSSVANIEVQEPLRPGIEQRLSRTVSPTALLALC